MRVLVNNDLDRLRKLFDSTVLFSEHLEAHHGDRDWCPGRDQFPFLLVLFLNEKMTLDTGEKG